MKFKYLKQKILTGLMVAVIMAAVFTGCKSNNDSTDTTEVVTEETASEADDAESDEIYSDRDMEQSPDLTDAKYIEVSVGEDINLTEEGIYVISGDATDVTINVENEEAKIQIVLDGVSITNTDSPVIYVKAADKVFVTTTEGSENNLEVTGEYVIDGEENLDAVIYSKDDLTLNGLGTINITSAQGNGISGKDDVVITGGTYNITAGKHGIEANDLMAICGGTFNIEATKDGLQSAATLQIDGGTYDISAAEAIEATEIIINDGKIGIEASDDGINASQKTENMDVSVTINGGEITITMGQGDTDAIDANGSIVINGGILEISAQSPFDYDETGELNGGTVTVNGETVTELTNQTFGGGMGGGFAGGNAQGFAGEMPSDGTMPTKPADGEMRGKMNMQQQGTVEMQ
ncbi:MAG: carbohydrate-binding domain-containing protein [Lachnospiraceae bacterium]|nr:carbohydrate-binding domain-containing protein [Lachnospiraceae bacterium]